MNEKIIAVKYQKAIRPVAYKTNLGNIYSLETALEAVEGGMIQNAYVFTDANGIKHIKHKKEKLE